MKKILFLSVFILATIALSAQQPFTQTIRGRVIDNVSKMPLPGANVVLLNSNPAIGTSTDTEGNFKLTSVPVGREGLQISFVGYKTAVIQNLIVNSAKEMVVEVELEENVIQTAEVVITASSKKDQPINKMATVSARSFTVEETEKYAGSRGDVARMAMNYAGVSAANDQRNDIIIRGNTPSGLLWKLEDIDIPNPNHFAEGGTTGGPVGMLNNNLLVNSDFLTGAFPAEYGNALSGVFDLKMRNGNTNRHEFLFQSGFNGFELGAEGPLSKNHKSSYLANYRYSTLQLMENIINVGTSGVPKYQDFSFKLNFPMKKGKLSVFGIAGISEIAMLDSKKTDKEMYSMDGQNLTNRSKMAATGIAYTAFLNDKTYYKVAFSALLQDGGTIIDTLDMAGIPKPYIDHSYAEYRTSASAYLHHKYNSHLSTKAGFTIDRSGYDLLTNVFNKDDNDFRAKVDEGKNLFNGVTLFRTYYQATYKFTDKVSINPGVHFIFFDLNASKSIEPRFGINWQVTDRQKLSAGYGLHSKIQAMSTYFLGTRLDNGSFIETNTGLGFTKSHQIVAGYDVSVTKNTRLKVEAYYQSMFDVPVEKYPTSFSMLNTGATWGIAAEDSLVNSGAGKNYGLELTFERFFSNNYYYLATVSLFQSKYKGSDGVERNTAFNGNYVINCLVGKEFTVSSRSAFTIDFKTSFAGGKRYTPVNFEASKLAGETKFIEKEAFSKQFDPFFKADIKFGYRRNGKKISQEWQFYIENFTNHKNVLMQVYSRTKNEVKDSYQLGIFPMVLYRIHF